MPTAALKLGLAVIGGLASCAVMAHLDRPLWELLLSLVLPGIVLYALDWTLDRIWPRPPRRPPVSTPGREGRP